MLGNNSKTWVVTGKIEKVLKRSSQVKPRFGEPDGVNVRPDQILVGEVQPGWRQAPATMRPGRLKKYWSCELPVEQ